jgi:hypothetical protein
VLSRDRGERDLLADYLTPNTARFESVERRLADDSRYDENENLRTHNVMCQADGVMAIPYS